MFRCCIIPLNVSLDLCPMYITFIKMTDHSWLARADFYSRCTKSIERIKAKGQGKHEGSVYKTNNSFFWFGWFLRVR
jgi:hypothetical protein